MTDLDIQDKPFKCNFEVSFNYQTILLLHWSSADIAKFIKCAV